MRDPSTKPLTLLPLMFSGLLPADQVAMKQDGRYQSVAKGEIIQKEGERSPRVIMMQSGWGVLSIKGKVLFLTGPGRTYTPSLKSEIPNVTTLTAISPVLTVSFDRGVLVRSLMRSPPSLAGVVDISINRILDFQKFLYQMGRAELEQRIAEVLWDVSTPQSDGSRLVPPCITQKILAEVLQTSREAINKKMKTLATAGYLQKREDGWYLAQSTPMFTGSL
jgi:CRP-like cAMP-binding protein